MEKFEAHAINVCGSLSGVVATCKNEVWADRLAEALNAQEAIVAGDDPELAAFDPLEKETLARFQAARQREPIAVKLPRIGEGAESPRRPSTPTISFGGVPSPIPAILQCTMDGELLPTDFVDRDHDGQS